MRLPSTPDEMRRLTIIALVILYIVTNAHLFLALLVSNHQIITTLIVFCIVNVLAKLLSKVLFNNPTPYSRSLVGFVGWTRGIAIMVVCTSANIVYEGSIITILASDFGNLLMSYVVYENINQPKGRRRNALLNKIKDKSKSVLESLRRPVQPV